LLSTVNGVAESAGDVEVLSWHAALLRQGWAVLHGAAFEIGPCSVLAVGESRAGKSTLAAAVARCGGRILSDDLVACRLDGGQGPALARALRGFVSLRDSGRSVFPGQRLGALRAVEGEREGRWVLTREDAPELFVQQVALNAIWLCGIRESAGATELSRVGAGGALGALLASTSAGLLEPDRCGLSVRLMGILIGLVSACRLGKVRLGRDLLDCPEAVVARLTAFLS
jgi:hypothetical protein